MQPTQVQTKTGPGGVPAASAKYVSELDGIRAVAVCFVVVAHYRLLPYTPGGFGVTLFFFLSGYLITTLFYSEQRSTNRINVRRFYLRRWLRLTPPLIALVVLGVVFHRISRTAVGGGPVPTGEALAALFYFTNYYDLLGGMDLNYTIPFGICWSLAIEEHFYLLWPWIIRKTVTYPRRLCAVVVGVCVGVLMWRLAARYIFLVSTEYTYSATDCRIDSILYGALLRVLFESPWAISALRILRARWCRVIALLALLITFVIRDDNFRETIRYSIEGIALMPLFTAVLSDDPRSLARRALSSSPMVMIGRLSYSIYLFHMLARTPAEVYFGSPFAVASRISGLLVTGAVAGTLFVLVERPLARLRHRFRSELAGEAGQRVAPLSEPTNLTPPSGQTPHA